MEIVTPSASAQARQDMLATTPVARLLWRLAAPAMAGMVTMALYHVVDTIFIGRGVGTNAIAGITIVFPLIMLLMALGLMLGIGAASVVSRRLGAGDISSAERTLGNTICLSVLAGVIVAAVAVPNLGATMGVLGASPPIVGYAMDYAEIIILGSALAIYPMMANNLARAEGNARIAMKSMILGATLNMALDPVFIFVLHLGVQGAAVATVVSQAVSAVYITRYFLSGHSTLRLRLRNLRLDWSVAVRVISVGFPSFVRMGAAGLMILIINRSLGTYGGDMSIAAFGIVNRSMVFLTMPLLAIAQGLQPILGFSYGAGRYDRALEVTKLSLGVASLFSAVSFVVLMAIPGTLMSVFTTDGALVSEGVYAARRIFLVYFLVGFQIVGSTVFQALGKVVKTLVTSTSRQLLFLVPLVLILPESLGTDGVWLAFPIADVLAFLLVCALILPQMREFRRRHRRQTLSIATTA